MEDTVDQTGNEEDDDENDKILISKKTHQVSPILFSFRAVLLTKKLTIRDYCII